MKLLRPDIRRILAVALHRRIERIGLRGKRGNVAVGRLTIRRQVYDGLARGSRGNILCDDFHLPGADDQSRPRIGRRITVGRIHHDINPAVAARIVGGIHRKISFYGRRPEYGRLRKGQPAQVELHGRIGIRRRIVARRRRQVEREPARHIGHIGQGTVRGDRSGVRIEKHYRSDVFSGHFSRSRQVCLDDGKSVPEKQGTEIPRGTGQGIGDQEVVIPQVRRIARCRLHLLRRQRETHAGRIRGRLFRIGIIGIERVLRRPFRKGNVSAEKTSGSRFLPFEGQGDILRSKRVAALDIDADTVARRPKHIIPVRRQFGARRRDASSDPHVARHRPRRQYILQAVVGATAQQHAIGRHNPRKPIHPSPPGRNLRPFPLPKPRNPARH